MAQKNTATKKITRTPRTKKDSKQNSRPDEPGKWKQYYNTLAHKMQPTNGKHKERLAIALTEWCQEKDSLVIEEFQQMMGIPNQTYYNWVANNNKLKEAHTFAVQQVGINREKLCLERNLGINSVAAFMLPRYSKSWKDEMNRRAELKHDKENNVPHTFVLPDYFKKEDS